MRHNFKYGTSTICSVESNGKLPHLFIPSKTATLVPEFAVEDLPLGRIAALVPEFAVKELPLGRTLMMMLMRVNFSFLNDTIAIF